MLESLFHYFETTFSIIVLALGFSLVWSIIVYELTFDRPVKTSRAPQSRVVWLVPTIVVAPMLLIFSYKAFQLNLIYPVREYSDTFAMILHGIIPALVLIVSSGLGLSLFSEVKQQSEYWKNKPFVKLIEASGLEKKKLLRKLILPFALTHSWSRCLPWFFCELLLVEVVFNAPGLALDVWQSAKIRDSQGFLISACLILIIYAVFAVGNSILNQNIGKKLAGYQ